MSLTRRESYQRVLDTVRTLPQRRLITGVFWEKRTDPDAGFEYDFCATGAAAYATRTGKRRAVSQWPSLADGLYLEIEQENDQFEGTPEERWAHMVKWLEEKVASCP